MWISVETTTIQINGYHLVRTKLPTDLYLQRIDQTSIDQNLAVTLNGTENTRYRHRSADRRMHITF